MLYNTILSRTPLSGGWSADRKYRAEAADGSVWFLRIGVPSREARLREVFGFQQQAADLGLPVARPLECGSCAEGFYTLESWIDGTDARIALPSRSEAQRYEDGLLAGRVLRRLHSIPAPAELPDWETRFNQKIERRVAEYLACPLKYERDEPLLSGISGNRELLKDRPQSFQHHDYHVGNFMYEHGALRIIDFDRFAFGDPWQEFQKLPWCVQASPALARGMVDGYFDGPPPEEFWRLLSLYLCCLLLGNLPWAIPYGEEEVRVMRRQAEQVLSWYGDGIVPAWYRPRP